MLEAAGTKYITLLLEQSKPAGPDVTDGNASEEDKRRSKKHKKHKKHHKRERSSRRDAALPKSPAAPPQPHPQDRRYALCLPQTTLGGAQGSCLACTASLKCAALPHAPVDKLQP